MSETGIDTHTVCHSYWDNRLKPRDVSAHETANVNRGEGDEIQCPE